MFHGLGQQMEGMVMLSRTFCLKLVKGGPRGRKTIVIGKRVNFWKSGDRMFARKTDTDEVNR